MTELPQWVDGPRFADWIERVRPDYRIELSPNLSRTIARLKEPATRGKVDTVDRICVALFLHLSEIPEEVWADRGPGHGRRITREKQDEALRLVRSGIPQAEVARRLRLHYSTVYKWVKEAA